VAQEILTTCRFFWFFRHIRAMCRFDRQISHRRERRVKTRDGAETGGNAFVPQAAGQGGAKGVATRQEGQKGEEI
jgi:hypothetical protein